MERELMNIIGRLTEASERKYFCKTAKIDLFETKLATSRIIKRDPTLIDKSITYERAYQVHFETCFKYSYELQLFQAYLELENLMITHKIDIPYFKEKFTHYTECLNTIKTTKEQNEKS